MIDLEVRKLAMKMDEYQNQVRDGMKFLDGRMDKQDINLAKNNVILEEHVKRTALLESAIEPLKQQAILVNQHAEQLVECSRVRDNQIKLHGFFKISGIVLGAGSAIAGIVFALSRLL